MSSSIFELLCWYYDSRDFNGKCIIFSTSWLEAQINPLPSGLIVRFSLQFWIFPLSTIEPFLFITFELPVREKKIKRGRKDTEEKREREVSVVGVWSIFISPKVKDKYCAISKEIWLMFNFCRGHQSDKSEGTQTNYSSSCWVTSLTCRIRIGWSNLGYGKLKVTIYQ